ncbi:hypothetical protein AMATHDRAFT_88168 [Amanita thiersii Skay4041]|uniref:Uncharacterized protein n=1 Tax=Amanita thiersii Skay4041 TaxID=703135 RepID=A0A2A9NG71_9AGAR|nr:hypothetical protein AMATHDRAFT_88168 [Amanita thiersii Skay4041]
MEAFRHTTTAGADAYYRQFQATKSVIKTAIYISVTWVSDALMLYRCCIVWNRSWLITAVTVPLLVADIAMGIWSLVLLGHLRMCVSIFAGHFVPVLQSFFVLTLVTNGLCANLIAFKLWNAQRRMERAIPNSSKATGQYHLTRAWVIVLEESGLVYWAALLAMLACYISGAAGAVMILLDITSPLIKMNLQGIVFSLIIVRVSLGFKPDGSGGRSISSLVFASEEPTRSSLATQERPVTRRSELSPVLTVASANNQTKAMELSPRRLEGERAPL